jgi:hypothetical protein
MFLRNFRILLNLWPIYSAEYVVFPQYTCCILRVFPRDEWTHILFRTTACSFARFILLGRLFLSSPLALFDCISCLKAVLMVVVIWLAIRVSGRTFLALLWILLLNGQLSWRQLRLQIREFHHLLRAWRLTEPWFEVVQLGVVTFAELLLEREVRVESSLGKFNGR